MTPQSPPLVVGPNWLDTDATLDFEYSIDLLVFSEPAYERRASAQAIAGAKAASCKIDAIRGYSRSTATRQKERKKKIKKNDDKQNIEETRQKWRRRKEMTMDETWRRRENRNME